jgi:beta-phosphoglucomutase
MSFRKLPIPKAVIWDFDGLLFDTIPLHRESWRVAFDGEGLPFDFETIVPLVGRRDWEIARILLEGDVEQDSIQATVDRIIKEKRSQYLALLENVGPNLNPGVMNWLEYFKDEGIRQAVASGTMRKFLQVVISRSNLSGYFECLISGEDTVKGKPAPDSLLLVVDQLGVQPPDCLVIEDAALGVSAAKSAGMYCLAVTYTQSMDSLRQADLVINSLADFPPGKIFMA